MSGEHDDTGQAHDGGRVEDHGPHPGQGDPEGDDEGDRGEDTGRAAVGSIVDRHAERGDDAGGEEVAPDVGEQAADHEGSPPDRQGPKAVEHPGAQIVGEGAGDRPRRRWGAP